jgi:putative oxidoreductase
LIHVKAQRLQAPYKQFINQLVDARRRHRMRSTMMDLLFVGVGWADLAITLNRIAVGAFFMLSGYHKLFNAERHRSIVDELKALGVPAVGFNQWWVPSVEFTAGGAVLIGLLAPLAALGLLVIILVAMATSGRQRIKLYKPIDESDRIDDWLYLPETLYAFMLILVVSAGAGPYSLDALILDLIHPGSDEQARGVRCIALLASPAIASQENLVHSSRRCTKRPPGRPPIERPRSSSR